MSLKDQLVQDIVDNPGGEVARFVQKQQILSGNSALEVAARLADDCCMRDPTMQKLAKAIRDLKRLPE